MPNVRRLSVPKQYEDGVFVSLEETPIVLADIRAALPRLQNKLVRRWPSITRVEITNRTGLRRRRNPHDPAQAAVAACLGIRVVWLVTKAAAEFVSVAAQAARKVVEPASEEIGDYLRGWIRARNPYALESRRTIRKAKKKARAKRPRGK